MGHTVERPSFFLSVRLAVALALGLPLGCRFGRCPLLSLFFVCVFVFVELFSGWTSAARWPSPQRTAQHSTAMHCIAPDRAFYLIRLTARVPAGHGDTSGVQLEAEFWLTVIQQYFPPGEPLPWSENSVVPGPQRAVPA
jgi:hypothetical protein